ncbi:MAG: hypothetical protein AUG83_07680 [Acidobacteria bacterium 13_1_20CM_4_57_11]|nr:MAG: hypothetical protein AUG83_07680 [Acidobacteria bacterium 13_1_20CM_4_57_11]
MGQSFFHGAKTPSKEWLLVMCEVIPFIALFFIVRLRDRARVDPKHFFLKLAVLIVILCCQIRSDHSEYGSCLS